MNYGLTKTRVRLASGAALLALSAGAAMAQEGVEQVVVSSTRLQQAGFDAPTPTTVVSAADLEAQAVAAGNEALDDRVDDVGRERSDKSAERKGDDEPDSDDDHVTAHKEILKAPHNSFSDSR